MMAARRIGLRRAAVAFALACAAVLSTGCASIPPGAGSNPVDPYERFNRHMFAFNDGFDRYVAKPVARGYATVLPEPVRRCVGNVFYNIGEVGNIINAGLQAEANSAAKDTGRLVVNSTAGVLGCFDVAKSLGWERNRQDFGLTMGKWGMTPGPYLVLPFLGPSSLRDALGEIPDSFTDPITYVRPMKYYEMAYVVRFVDRRAQYLSATDLVEQAALDPYAFVRDGYLQRRRSRVYNGSPPPDTLEDPDAPDTAPGPALPATAPARAVPKVPGAPAPDKEKP